MSSLHGIAIFLLSVLVAGCGYHLRGTVDLPAGIAPVYIGGINQDEPLSVALGNLLKASGVAVAADAGEGKYQLIILDQKQSRRTATLGEGARAAEYQLLESVEFELRDTRGQRVFGPNTLTERRVISNDPNQVASSTESENIQRREMLQSLAAKVARQLQSFDFRAASQAADAPSIVQ